MKKIFYFIIAFWLGASSIAAQPAYCGDGDGTEANPCEISTAEQLFALAAAVNTIANVSQGKYYKLVNDIDLSDYTAGEGWIPIGKNNDGYHFRGNFDGNGKVISNLTIIGENYQGLFGRTSGATIKNVIINNCNIRGLQSVGGLVGFAPGTIITNCHATGKVEGTDEVGGLLGYGNSSPVTDCTADCTVTGSLGTGGLVGNYLHSTLTNCSASGNVNGYNIVGGLVGFLCSAYMTGCFATGNVNGDENVGGLVGSGNVPITNSHATGNVSGNNRVGGLVGSNGSSTLTNCYATGTVNGENEVGGLVGYNSNTPLVNCYATGDVVGSENVGGLLGECFDSSTTNCHATGNVSGNNNIGGLVGNNNNSAAISNCYATGNVTGTNDVGGLVGWNTDYSTIENCYAAGTVNGNGAVGGLVGYSDASSISNCYAIGNVTGTSDRVGGLVGYCQLNSSISNCYAVGDVSGVIGNVGGLVGLCQFGSSITNSYAFNCKVEHAGTDVGRITGNSAGTLTNNYAHEQMELWANGTQITPTPNPNGKDGGDLTYLDAINPATYVGVFDSPWTFDYPNFNVSPNTNLPILSAFTPSAFPNAVQSPQIKKCNVEPLFCGGSGTIADPYLICTAEQLDSVRVFLDAHYKLANDINLTTFLSVGYPGYNDGKGWEPIGDAEDRFTGSLNGDGHRIIGLWINRTGDYIGLFGFIDGAVIRNVGLIISD